MQFTKALLATAVLALSVVADKHKYCNCHVDGALDKGLSHSTCTRWGETEPNTEWVDNRAACYDYVSGGGIDGLPWENTCKEVYSGDSGAVRGNCFAS